MSTEELAASKSRLSRAGKLGTLAYLSAALAAAWGILADFVPNPMVDVFAVSVSTLLAIPVAFALVARRRKKNLIPAAFDSPVVKWFGVAIVALFTWYFCWAAIGHGVPAAITAFNGGEYASVLWLEKKKGGGRRSCNYRLVGGEIAAALPAYICVDKSFFAKLPDGRLPYYVTGRKSWFGRLYENVERETSAGR